MLKDKLKAARLAAGLTQKKLAALSDLHWRLIQRYEAGTNEPNIQTLKKLADALNCRMEDLI